MGHFINAAYEFKKNIPTHAALVLLEQEGAMGPIRIEFGIEIPIDSEPPLQEEWVKTLQANVFQAKKGSHIFEKQLALIRLLYDLPPPQFMWILNQSDAQSRNPYLGMISTTISDEVNATDTHIVTQELTMAKAFQIKNEGWLFASPVNPETQLYYVPPDSSEISYEQYTAIFIENQLSEESEYSSSSFFKDLKTYVDVLRY